MLTTKWKTIVLLCALTTACDQASDEPSWRDEHPELALDDESVDDHADAIDRERIEESLAVQPWDDALAELLDLECDGRGRCTWVWADLEAVGLEGLVDELPEPPAAVFELQPAGDLTAVPDPSAVFAKQVYITSIKCIDQQEVFSDEPYLQVNGATIWSTNDADDGESFNIGQVHGFNTQLPIELWESDSGPSNDDKVGNTLVVHDYDYGEYTYSFSGNGGKYRLYYSVTNWGA